MASTEQTTKSEMGPSLGANETAGASNYILGGVLEGGQPLLRPLTDGGHALDKSQPAFPVYHRCVMPAHLSYS